MVLHIGTDRTASTPTQHMLRAHAGGDEQTPQAIAGA